MVEIYPNCTRKLRTTRKRLRAHPVSLTDGPVLPVAQPRRTAVPMYSGMTYAGDLFQTPFLFVKATLYPVCEILLKICLPPPSPDKKIAPPFLNYIKYKHINFAMNFTVTSSRQWRCLVWFSLRVSWFLGCYALYTGKRWAKCRKIVVPLSSGTLRGGTVGCGIALQPWRSRVRFPMVSL